MISNQGKYLDRNPNIIPAGKYTALGDSAKDCMETPKRVQTPEQIKKFRCTTQPSVGESRIFYGQYNDPDIASLLTHGVNTQPSVVAGDLVTPDPKSKFAQKVIEKRESIYSSTKRAPLGTSHDQSLGLPENTDPYQQRYGIQTKEDYPASELINPKKTMIEMEEENTKGQHLYKVSHSEYGVGESYDRSYDWSKVSKSSCFGVETPHDNRGTNVKKSLKWKPTKQSGQMTTIVSKRVDNFRERTQPQVGQVHDPIKDTLNTPSDHSYGILIKPDDYGAGDLIHMRFEDSYLRGKDRKRGILAATREHLKKANYHNFTDLKKAFAYYDKDGSGKISLDELKQICLQFKLPISDDILQELFGFCDVDNDGQINYDEFSNFLNWKEKMSPEDYNDTDNDSVSDPLRNQIDGSAVDYLTSSSELGSKVRDVPSSYIATHGVPTIRSDLPAPRIRRIGDNTNYGDESNAYGLINPSLYSNRGVHERDFFKPRQQNEIRRIFDSIGVVISPEMFQTIWDQAKANSGTGEVSVESFRHVMDEIVSVEYENERSKQEENQNFTQSTLVAAHEKPALYKQLHEKLDLNKESSKEYDKVLY